LSGFLNPLRCKTDTEEFVYQRFSETVRLADGSMIEVKAHTQPGRTHYAVSGTRNFAINIRRTLPNGVEWSNEEVIATTLDREERSWIIVAELYPELYAKYGCPLPPQVYFRNVGKKWVKVQATEVPDRMRVNLFLQRVVAMRDGQH
jgi:hypothetical protein